MSDSLDQPAAANDLDTNAQAQTPVAATPEMQRQTSPVAEREALAEGDEPQAAPSRKTNGLPVPVPAAPRAEPSADGKPIERSALAAEVAPSIESETAPHAEAAGAPLNFIPFQIFPPRQKKAGSARTDIWFRAAAVAIALGVGWIAGANTFNRSEDLRGLTAQLDAVRTKLADVAKAGHTGQETDLATLRKSVDYLSKGLAAQRTKLDTTKAGLDATKAGLDTTRSDLESIKTALQAAQAGLEASKPDMAKLDRLAERVDRLEHQFSSLMPTGAIPPASAAPAAARQSSSEAENTSHALPTKEQRPAVEKPKIPPNGYVLRDVEDGVAIIEDRTGLHEVVPGQVLAGIGRVESIERRGHRWVVVTSDGLIDSDPY
jgi:hypothetical protein